MHEMTCIAVIGSDIFSSGVHAWTVSINVSRLNYGGAICIGVTDAAAAFTSERGGWSCGFNPYCGALYVTGDAYGVNYHQPMQSLMHGDLQGKANNSSVTVIIDLNARELAFSINGAQPVLATVTGGLPSSVRPWVHLFKRGDSVSFAAAHELPYPMPDGRAERRERRAGAVSDVPESDESRDASFATAPHRDGGYSQPSMRPVPSSDDETGQEESSSPSGQWPG